MLNYSQNVVVNVVLFSIQKILLKKKYLRESCFNSANLFD